MHKVLKSYLKRLINLSANNRTLLLRRLISSQFIDLHDFDFALNKPSFQIVKDLIGQKSKVPLCKIGDSRDEETNKISLRLKKLLRIEKQLFEEHGSRDLYVGWPFIQGKLGDGTHIRCPMLFFPVELAQNNTQWVLRQKEGVNVALNKVFLLAYGHYNKIKVTDDLLDRSFDDFDNDSMVFRTGLYQLLKESSIELNFNQDNFIDKLEPFQSVTKQEFEAQEKNGELKLFPHAVLGIFPQSGSHLVPDYETLLSAHSFSDLEAFFEERTQNELEGDRYGFLSRVKEEQTFTPFKLDAFQENALKAVKKGNSIVVQGPPGTGKSQLICNLIADYIAREKKVLLVCQKRAALDVVYHRFDEVGITNFIGLVHDFRSDRKALYGKIGHQINRIDEYRLSNNSLDALHLERQFTLFSRKIDQLSEEMEEFKAALFDEQECGISAKELYLTSSISGLAVNVKQEYRHFKFDNLAETLTRLRNYGQYAASFRVEEYPLLERKSFAGSTITTLRRMQEFLGEIPQYQKQIGDLTKEITGHEIKIEECLDILDKRERIKELLRILQKKQIYSNFKVLVYSHGKEEDLHWLTHHERVMMGSFDNDGVESIIESKELGHFQKSLQSAIAAQRNFIKWLNWLLFSKQRPVIDEALKANHLSRNRKGLKVLINRVDNRLNLEHNFTLLNEKDWVVPYTGLLDKGQLQLWFHDMKEAFRAKIIFASLRNFKEYFNIKKLEYTEFRNELDELFKEINHIPDLWERWSLYFTTGQLRRLTTDSEWLETVSNTLATDFESLCDFDQLRQEMPGYEQVVVNKILELLEEFDVERMEKVFQNSIRLQWIEHIETKYPALRMVSSMKFRQMEAELQKSVQEKLKISNEILLLRIKERTYQDVEFNRLNNMVTYRDLEHQVTKQRRVWPLRKVIGNYSEELFNLIPCWLASPETVSAIFPMENLFDLVIFDEASQCFTERGIPSMYRGKQVVVAGDNKQLRPNDLYQARWEDEDEEDVSIEVDSLLELASQYLMNVQLNEHYRSKKIELIDFSNNYFYDNKLKILPDRNLVNAPDPAIDYIKVNGVWDKNTNRIEAGEVADIVFNLIENCPAKEIGIVTFNARQQDLIMDVLEEAAISREITLPDTLMIKNIENVQGDEKDIIIFSTAYAPDANGKLIMQFGSLNMLNGENRLNVAVTRAREKIIIVSSILPQQLNVGNAKNEGPRLLKEYLKYAKMVSDGKYKSKPKTRLNKNNAWYLKDLLIDWGNKEFSDCNLREELPFADITIVKDGKYSGLLITDDELYFQSPSIKDSHVYTPFTLSGKHWKFRGIFSREYWQNESMVTQDLTRFISQSISD
jgi:superfamily I DNA and/or RNA helicase